MSTWSGDTSGDARSTRKGDTRGLCISYEATGAHKAYESSGLHTCLQGPLLLAVPVCPRIYTTLGLDHMTGASQSWRASLCFVRNRLRCYGQWLTIVNQYGVVNEMCTLRSRDLWIRNFHSNLESNQGVVYYYYKTTSVVVLFKLKWFRTDECEDILKN